MTNRAVNVTVTTEVGYCPFCQRTRTLRREERHLGGLVRTNIACETCHRTLSSTIGVPQPKVDEPLSAPPEPAPAAPEPPKPAEAEAEAEVKAKLKPAPRPQATSAKKPAARSKGATPKTRA